MSKALHTFTFSGWEQIKLVCNNKSGIYCILNKINNKYYIGSSVNLYNRLRGYTQP